MNVQFPLVLLCIFLLSCSSDSDSPTDGDGNTKTPATGKPYVQCTVSGPDLPATTFTSDTELKVYHTSYTYDAEEDRAIIQFINHDMSLALIFSGQSTGTFAIGDQNLVTIGLELEGDDALKPLSSRSGTLVITELVESTGTVRGTFSGSFLSMNNVAYTITDGSFFLKRR